MIRTDLSQAHCTPRQLRIREIGKLRSRAPVLPVSGALKIHFDTQIAEVKRMWVASDVRGLGLGRRLLERLSAEAASRGMVML
jgi:GNAT superfamily N-acetyltransferase